MSYRVHWMNTGEIEVALGTSLLGLGYNPKMPGGQILTYGYQERIERADGTVGSGTMVPIPLYYIEGTKQKVIVDTGTNAETCKEGEVLTEAYGGRQYWYTTPEQDVRTQLGRLGVTPEEIDIVIMTHLHLDHIGNTKLFPNARFIVQRDELAWFMAPPIASAFYYPELRHYFADIMDQVDCIEGDMQVESGIDLVLVGGHTPGSMVVLIETVNGKVGLVGDFYYNYVNMEYDWPPGAYWDLGEWLRNSRRIKQMADIVIPNHDYYYMKLYPEGVIE